MIGFFLITLSVLSGAVLTDLIVSRLSGKRVYGYATSFLLTLFGIPLVWLFHTSSSPDIFEIVISLGIGLMWWFIYLNVVQAVESSLRLRMLFEVREKGGVIDEKSLAETYSDSRLIRLRMKRMLDGGAITVEQDTYFLVSNQLRHIARFFTGLKKLFLGKTSQFH